MAIAIGATRSRSSFDLSNRQKESGERKNPRKRQAYIDGQAAVSSRVKIFLSCLLRKIAHTGCAELEGLLMPGWATETSKTAQGRKDSEMAGVIRRVADMCPCGTAPLADLQDRPDQGPINGFQGYERRRGHRWRPRSMISPQS